MYEMAKKAREAMRGKAKRLSGEKDQKTDSSNWTPADPLNADVKTGMRPISKQGYKRGGKIAGEKAEVHAGRKPRKTGGRAITADSLINRNQKEANEEREGKKHIGGLKTGGRAGKALGGAPTDILKAVRAQTMGFKKGGKIKKADGGMADYDTGSRTGAGAVTEDRSPSKPTPPMPQRRPDYDTGSRTGAGAVTRSGRKAGGNVNYGPMEMPAGKKGLSTAQQIAEEKREQGMSKPKRGKAGHYDYGGTVPMQPTGPDGRMSIVDKNKLGGAPAGGSPYKKGGMAKHEDVAEDKALIKKMVKPSARTGKNVGGMSAAAGRDDGDSYNPRYLGSAQSEAPFKDTSAGAPMREAAEEVGRRMKGRPRGAPGDMAPMPRKSGGMADKWIAGAIKHKGALHKSLGVPAGEKIPEKKLEKAEHSKNPKLAKRARLAETLKSMHRTAKFGGGGLSGLNMGPAKAAGGPAKGKGRTTIAININAGAKPQDQMGAGMPGMPPGMPPRSPGGIPVPMGMPPAGGAPPAGIPMPMPAPPAMPQGAPAMARKAGGKVYKSYKDMDAGAGSGLGRLEKTEIQKRKA